METNELLLLGGAAAAAYFAYSTYRSQIASQVQLGTASVSQAANLIDTTLGLVPTSSAYGNVPGMVIGDIQNVLGAFTGGIL